MQNMTNRFYVRERIYQLLLMFLFTAVYVLAYQLYDVKQEKVSSSEEIFTAVSVLEENLPLGQTPIYYVSLHGDVVYVRSLLDQTRSFLLKNIDARTMRVMDAERFENGFYLYSEEDLSQLLEDYGS